VGCIERNTVFLADNAAFGTVLEELAVVLHVDAMAAGLDRSRILDRAVATLDPEAGIGPDLAVVFNVGLAAREPYPVNAALYEAVVDGLKKLGKPASLDKLVTLFRTPWPDGLSKEGAKLHRQQSVNEYTLITHLSLLDKGQYIRWQRDPKTLKMPKNPETYQF